MENSVQRLNQAFRNLESRVAALRQQVQHHPEIELLEQENRQLHEELSALRAENTRLQGVVEELGEQLDQVVDRLENLMEAPEMHAEGQSYEHR